ncbi:copper transport repressor, CopY/TcrY family [Streptococcus henryi]|uniref:Copper transport repressor, CopY/TcrY family n=1 Tax=Streptococcus henryi TaxID=439219 RepID=A0A1G6D5L9_9STRE|nr:CopY/TcrY family copper transport repressor [Streptococcus henryi]SDB40447.1 copper transport repressor, CopY/TcrY family [Streptococcus henryi]
MSISNAEWEIMRVVWAKGRTTSNEILDILSQKTDWTSSTVKTLLRRLVDKGYLATEKVGKSFVYSALLTESDSINAQADGLFSKFCQRKHVAILEHLLEQTLMTEADIDQLQALLLSKKTEAVEQVPCNCTPGQCNCQEHVHILEEVTANGN